MRDDRGCFPCSVKLTSAMCSQMDLGLLGRGSASTVWRSGSSQGNTDHLRESPSLPCHSLTSKFNSQNLCEWLFVTPWGVARQPPCPWSSPGKNTGVGSHSLLQIFPTQGSNPDLPHCRQILYCLSHQRSPMWMTTRWNGSLTTKPRLSSLLAPCKSHLLWFTTWSQLSPGSGFD